MYLFLPLAKGELEGVLVPIISVHRFAVPRPLLASFCKGEEFKAVKKTPSPRDGESSIVEINNFVKESFCHDFFKCSRDRCAWQEGLWKMKLLSFTSV